MSALSQRGTHALFFSLEFRLRKQPPKQLITTVDFGQRAGGRILGRLARKLGVDFVQNCHDGLCADHQCHSVLPSEIRGQARQSDAFEGAKKSLEYSAKVIYIRCSPSLHSGSLSEGGRRLYQPKSTNDESGEFAKFSSLLRGYGRLSGSLGLIGGYPDCDENGTERSYCLDPCGHRLRPQRIEKVILRMTNPNQAQQPAPAHCEEKPVTPAQKIQAQAHFLGGVGWGRGWGAGCGRGEEGVDFCPQSLFPRRSGGLLGCEGAMG